MPVEFPYFDGDPRRPPVRNRRRHPARATSTRFSVRARYAMFSVCQLSVTLQLLKCTQNMDPQQTCDSSFRHHIKIIIAHTQCLESSRNIHRIVANIGGHSQHCIDIHIDKTKRAGGSPGVSCCLSYVASTGNCIMQNHFLEEDLAYFRCVLKIKPFI